MDAFTRLFLLVWFFFLVLIMSYNIYPPAEDSLLVSLKLCTTVFHRYSRLGSWVPVGGTAVFVGASCIPVEVAQFLSTQPKEAASNKLVSTNIGS